MFRATDAKGHLTRIYRSDAAGNGAYFLSAVIETDALPPEQTPLRIRNAWARGVFAINLSGVPAISLIAASQWRVWPARPIDCHLTMTAMWPSEFGERWPML
jgi:hypothetical protein